MEPHTNPLRYSTENLSPNITPTDLAEMRQDANVRFYAGIAVTLSLISVSFWHFEWSLILLSVIALAYVGMQKVTLRSLSPFCPEHEKIIHHIATRDPRVGTILGTIEKQKRAVTRFEFIFITNRLREEKQHENL